MEERFGACELDLTVQSPPERFCIQMGSHKGCFRILLSAKGRITMCIVER